MDTDELEDYLDVRDPKLQAQIRQGNLDIRAGLMRRAEELLKELEATASKPSRRSK